jgi:hypothetical protein
MAKRFDPKAKARKQKILAAGLGVVFVGVLVFQAPTILGMFKGSSTPASSTPAPAPAPTPTPTAPGAAPAPAPAPEQSGQLVDSDLAPEPAEGQLVSFDRFESKDPFIQQVSPGGPAATTGNADEPPAQPSGDEGLAPEDEVNRGQDESPEQSDAPSSETRTAKISVNGVATDVAVSGTFPENQPIFKLVSLKGTTAKVGIVDGAYSTGSPTITLKKGGKPVTLMNTADGTTYVLRLVSVSG